MGGMATYEIGGRAYECPVQLAAETLGGKWKLHIAWHLAQEPDLRFSELRRRILGGISEKMLITSLKDLEADGLITRTAFPEVPPRVSYALTPTGQELVPVLAAMSAFGKHYQHS